MKVTSIILAPLRDVSTATSKDRIQELIDSNRIDVANPEASYLKYFYVEPNPALRARSGAVVDFSKCFSVRKNSYDMLLERKVAQLADDVVASMALKLALYFHRSNDVAA